MKRVFHQFSKLSKWVKVATICGAVLALLVVGVIGMAVYASNQSKEMEEINQWLQSYYRKPQPDKMVEMILRIERSGLLDNPDASQPLGGFFTGVFANNPDRLENWFSEFSRMQPKHRDRLLKCLWYSNTPEAKLLLKKIASSQTADKEWLVALIKTEPLPFEKAPLTSPAILDVLWGEFFATGEQKYVERIAEVADVDSASGSQILVAGAALWSLSSNAETHPKVRTVYQAFLKEHPKAAKEAASSTTNR